MRCPKCGYISFDHLDTCLKCNKEISKASDSLRGTAFNVAPPSFLKIEPTPQEEVDTTADIDFEDGIDMDAIDPDLDILLDDDGNSDDALGEISALTDDDDTFTITDDLDDDEEDGIAIDFNQFEDADLDDDDSSSELSMDMPDELADLSDLEPSSVAPAEDDMQLELNLDDFDADLGSLGDDDDEPAAPSTPSEPPPAPAADDEISFNDLDIDLSDDSPASESSNDDDDDLNFDLDLGGLSLDK